MGVRVRGSVCQWVSGCSESFECVEPELQPASVAAAGPAARKHPKFRVAESVHLAGEQQDKAN